jgi:hypothetical protein
MVNFKKMVHFFQSKFIRFYYKAVVFLKDIIEALNAPAKYPGCSGTRNLSDNISDLKAQIAANKKVDFNELFFFYKILHQIYF